MKSGHGDDKYDCPKDKFTQEKIDDLLLKLGKSEKVRGVKK